MGFWTRLTQGRKALPFDTYDAAQRVLPEPYEPFMSTYGIPVMDPGIPFAEYGKRNVDALWRSQPNVRKVVDFIARNVASIPLHVYERVSDTNRQRVTTGPLAATVASPQRRIAPFRFWHSVISDALLYDRWAVMKVPTPDGRLELVQVPSWRLWLRVDGLRRVTSAAYWVGDQQPLQSDRDGWRDLDMETLIFDHGYAPSTAGMSPMETLADILQETSEAVVYRRQVWKNGARAPQWVYRDKAWPSKEARDRFIAGLQAYTRDGGSAGGLPMFEDGMELRDGKTFASSDALDLEGRKLSGVEVASAFHIAPELVGARDGTYSNVDAFRQMLYRDSLGPYITAWEGALNAQLTPELSAGKPYYIEAHIETKLRGSFEEQAKVKQSATGAPWLTRNEARALENRPPIEGGDELVTPLNVLVGGQASPRDSAPKARRPQVKAAAPDSHREKLSDVLSAFFARQGKSVLSAIGSGGDWWDAKRWNTELADDLLRATHTLANLLGKSAAADLGFPDGYDPDRTVEFLRAVSERYASTVNETTKAQLDAAVRDEDADPAHVFEVAKDSRAAGVAATVATFTAGFATVEAAKQIAEVNDVTPTKVWITGPNPRPEHAAMDGDRVGIDEPFANGDDWPGGLPGCNCSVSVEI